jgi:hypothetical protein
MCKPAAEMLGVPSVLALLAPRKPGIKALKGGRRFFAGLGFVLGCWWLVLGAGRGLFCAEEKGR